MTKDPLIGQQLGNFAIERLIGRGGMAYVYYGWDVNLERPVALKVIDARYRDNPDYATRFVREARAVAACRHENIIQIYHAEEQEGLYYFAMEYIDGMDLGKLLTEYANENELMPLEDVLCIGQAIASALDYAHDKGLIHRDVKPANVLISGDNRVVLTDFGLAMDIQVGTMGETFGSARYIAPEQARSSANACTQSDLYSLGVILYEMLTGQVPFDDPSSTSVALQHITQAPPAPREINASLNLETEVVLLKALGKDPTERYPSGAELIQALEKAASQPTPDTACRLSAKSTHERVTVFLSSHKEPPDSPSRQDVTLLGRQLDEYRLDTLLGQGGMARVYRGLDVNLERYVAIKVIDTPFRSDSDYIERFKREAQAIAKLEHPRIVRLYRYGESHSQLYMAMQYIEGADLGFVLDNYQQDQEFIQAHEAQRIVREICQALDYAHDKGVIHRDIKPSNIMLDHQGNAYLTDFGLALLTQAGTRGEIFGSPHFMSPEQAVSSANVVPQSDLYALGVVLYKMFTNQLPFDAPDPLDIAMKHLSETPRPPSELRPDISPELEAVILKAMAQDPQERYASGAELADALEQALTDEQPAVPSQRMIPQLVAAELEQNPLPPIPPTVATPTPEQTQAAETAWQTISTASAEPTQAPPTPVETGWQTVSAVPATTAKQATTAPPQSPLPPLPAAIAPAQATAEPEQTSSPAPQDKADKASALFSMMNKRNITCTALSALVGGLVLLVLFAIVLLIINSGSESAVKTPTTDLAAGAAQQTPTPTKTATPTKGNQIASDTGLPTATSQITMDTAVPATPTSTPTPAAAIPTLACNLLIAAKGEESLFIFNQAEQPLALERLILSGEKGTISGDVWTTATQLDPGKCVAIWQQKDNGKVDPPKELKHCEIVSELYFEKDYIFWKKEFGVYCDQQLVGTCKEKPDECQIPNDRSFKKERDDDDDDDDDD